MTTTPTVGQTEAVYVILDVESIRRPATRRQDRQVVRDVISRITNVTHEDTSPYVTDYAEPSEYDSSMTTYHGKWAGMLTVPQWMAVADNLCLDLTRPYEPIGNDTPVLPDNVDETMGSLTEYGWLPAVSIPYVDEGWGSYAYEPALIISMYVSVLLKEGNSNAL